MYVQPGNPLHLRISLKLERGEVKTDDLLEVGHLPGTFEENLGHDS
jgi:hypothetical protein